MTYERPPKPLSGLVPVVRMRSRDTTEAHRASTPLELLFDLTFVVAISSVVTQLAHGIGDGDIGAALPNYLMVFFAIWWAWLNFTWFASAYDTDDVPYRLLTMLQMGGVLVLAAGVPSAFGADDWRLITAGYFIMRIALVVQWLRAAAGDPEGRPTALRYALGISVVQALWIIRVFTTGGLSFETNIAIFAALAVCEMIVPIWAERPRQTLWHPHHVAERYSLFTIIVLGESVLAATVGVQSIVSAGSSSGEFVLLAASGLALLFGLWWVYFLEPAGDGLERNRGKAFVWGYGHYAIFAALAALGAGLEVSVEQIGHEVTIPAVAVAYAIAVPVAVFLVAMWALHRPLLGRTVIPAPVSLGAALAALLLPLLTAVAPLAVVVLLITLTVAGVIALTIVVRRPQPDAAAGDSGLVEEIA